MSRKNSKKDTEMASVKAEEVASADEGPSGYNTETGAGGPAPPPRYVASVSGADDDVADDAGQTNVLEDNEDEKDDVLEPIKAEDEPPAPQKNLVDRIASRNWFLLFHMTVLGGFIGYILYLVTANQDLIWYFGLTFCVLAFGIDASLPRRYREINVWKEGLLRYEVQPNFDGVREINFPLRSEYYDILGSYAGSCTVYAVGKNPALGVGNEDADVLSNGEDLDTDQFERELGLSGIDGIGGGKGVISRVSKMGDYRALAVRERVIHTQEGYEGYEIGGGIGAAIGSVVSVIVSVLRFSDKVDILPANWFNTEGAEILTWVLFICFIMFCLILLGCVVELEMRRLRLLYPIGWSSEEMKWFSLFEVADWNYRSVGMYAKTVSTNDPQSKVALLAYRFFQIILGVVLFAVKAAVSLVYLIFRNPALGLWVVVTVAMCFTYYAHVEKSDDELVAAVAFTIVAIVVAFIAMFVTSSGDTKDCGCCCCGPKKRVSIISESRVTGGTQRRFKICFAINALLLIVVAFLLLATIFDHEEEHIFTEEYTPSSLWDNTNCEAYFDQLDALDNNPNYTVSESPVVTVDANATTPSPTGQDLQDALDDALDAAKEALDAAYPLCPQYEELVTTVTILSLVWFILWVLALIWYFVDSTTFNVVQSENQKNGEFREYALFTIKRRIYGDLQQRSFESVWAGSWFMWLFGGLSYKYEYIWMDIDAAIALHKYLLKVTRMKRFNDSILINPWLPYILPPTGQPAQVPGVSGVLLNNGK